MAGEDGSRLVLEATPDNLDDASVTVTGGGATETVAVPWSTWSASLARGYAAPYRFRAAAGTNSRHPRSIGNHSPSRRGRSSIRPRMSA